MGQVCLIGIQRKAEGGVGCAFKITGQGGRQKLPPDGVRSPLRVPGSIEGWPFGLGVTHVSSELSMVHLALPQEFSESTEDSGRHLVVRTVNTARQAVRHPESTLGSGAHLSCDLACVTPLDGPRFHHL